VVFTVAFIIASYLSGCCMGLVAVLGLSFVLLVATATTSNSGIVAFVG
jgi:hypothetical protein